MKKINVLILVTSAVVLCFTACGKKIVVDETHSFANNTWLRFEPEEFEADIRDIDAGYNLIITLKYDTNILTDRVLPLNIDFYSDPAEKHNFTPDIQLIDRQGKRRGTTIEQYCTVTDTIERIRLYNRKGVHTYQIKQRTSRYELTGVSSMSFKIERVADI